MSRDLDLGFKSDDVIGRGELTLGDEVRQAIAADRPP
jgi:hypothetical protein